MMLSGVLAAVAMEWWECCLVCACGVVIGWKARGVLQAEASGSKTEPPSSEWASEIGAFWDPRAKKRWRISISELSFECEEQNQNIKARVCGGDLDVCEWSRECFWSSHGSLSCAVFLRCRKSSIAVSLVASGVSQPY